MRGEWMRKQSLNKVMIKGSTSFQRKPTKIEYGLLTGACFRLLGNLSHLADRPFLILIRMYISKAL